jgi:hypothetical protein
MMKPLSLERNLFACIAFLLLRTASAKSKHFIELNYLEKYNFANGKKSSGSILQFFATGQKENGYFVDKLQSQNGHILVTIKKGIGN